MEKNILSFVYKRYIFYNTKNLILRILGLFLISCSAIFYVEIGSPAGSLSYFAGDVFHDSSYSMARHLESDI